MSLPRLSAAWMEAVLGAPVPAEPRATCAETQARRHSRQKFAPHAPCVVGTTSSSWQMQHEAMARFAQAPPLGRLEFVKVYRGD